MRAAVHDRYGPPEVVRVEEVPDPAPGPGEILVRVRATTVNRTDTAYRAGRPWFARAMYGPRRPRARVLGCEYAGTVEAVGDGVHDRGVGDRVYGYVEGPFGAHAELMTVRSDGWVETIPDHLSFAEAATVTEGPHYAWAFCERLQIGPDTDVLVHGATGAIGAAAVQLAASCGATVTAVCDAAHADLVRSLGADRVIARDEVDFTRDAARFDVVMDAVGKSSFARCRRLLRPHGVYASSELGPGGVNLLLALAPWARVRFPAPVPDGPTRRVLHELVTAERLVPVVDRHYALEDITAAHRYVESGRKVGSVVVDVS
ncbi:NAD(P)-dependent alcohol dehydrogenase [Isoptericola haloaureus]|uniref:NAD(P)-dependent alcohol dehydrogenase n=1 Tax=Isoptericola haloaureus TaxID=1542902 RepID=A0ABU7Z678_9MICO